MDTLTIRSGRDSFLMIDRIVHYDPDLIIALKNEPMAPTSCGFSVVETLAQTGAFHIRRYLDFQKHAFLMGISSFSGPCALPAGSHTITGRCTARTRAAFEYALSGEYGDGKSYGGIFLFAVMDYGGEFKKESLENHYRDLYECLTRDSEKNSNSSD
jgi:hypothetical protein